MALSKSQIRHLRGVAHELKPVVMIGQQGLKDTIFEELEIALDVHELIKVRVSTGDRDERDEMIQTMLKKSKAELIQRIGNIAVLFRRNLKEPKIALPHK